MYVARLVGQGGRGLMGERKRLMEGENLVGAEIPRLKTRTRSEPKKCAVKGTGGNGHGFLERRGRKPANGQFESRNGYAAELLGFTGDN